MRPVLALLLLIACSKTDGPRFRLLSARESGIDFANTIRTDDSVNVQNDVYVYNGAGVAIGDVDHDGRPDVYLTGNQVSSRLYRNLGGMKFEDVTARAHVGTTRWATGAAMVDINDDGWLDIYVSVSGHPWSSPADRANLLFVNNRDGTFTESAARYGVADSGFTTQSAFLDYDHDGCIDLFVLNNSPEGFSRGADVSHPGGIRNSMAGGTNQLYHNECHGTGAPAFTNVSRQAGILDDVGYGLGVVIADVNRDGWPDIYVSNDATPNDVLYVNNHDGTFTNHIDWLKHASFAGMGADIADYNNDGWPDIVQSDMLPHDLPRQKRMSGFMTYSSQLERRNRGFREDYSENSLQLSNGVDTAGNVVFSEIGRMAGVNATEWSWSTLFADLDNDGWKDLIVSNGYPKAVNDFDYQSEMSRLGRRRDSTTLKRLGLAILAKLPGYDVSNFVFRNRGDLTFADETAAWGLRRPSYSYGVAYADLNGDGRLDLVVNNIDASAFVYQNVGGRPAAGRDRADTTAAHFLQVVLRGPPAHPLTGAIGASIAAVTRGREQSVYYSPYRGYMSSMDATAHFGLGPATRVDTLRVTWPDGAQQTLINVRADTTIVVTKPDSQVAVAPPAALLELPRVSRPFREVASISTNQRLPSQIDLGVQSLIPYMISRHGPAVAVGDVNGDDIDDVFVGGGNGQPAAIYLGTAAAPPASRLRPAAFSLPPLPSPFDDWGATFFDANGDGRMDLYVTTGSYFAVPNSASLQDRLFINRGGRFVQDSAALPPIPTSTGVVRAADFDGDGRTDLFVAGRLTPRMYPLPTRSYILHNEGGRFTDVTAQVAPDLVTPGGMITDAAWVDYDGDGRLDLVTVGEWMPIQLFHNDGSKFTRVALPQSRGWWFSLAVGDFDADGRPDLVAGNLGLNHSYTASPGSPFGVYAGDFSGNRSTDVVLTKTLNRTEYPWAGLVPLGREIYSIGLRFPSYAAMATASITQVFDSTRLRQATHYQADTFASVVLHNDGGGRFSMRPLPTLAEIAPIRGMVVSDVDGDGRLDLLVAGNIYDTEPNTAPADAGNGLWLRGDGRGAFIPVSPRESGFLAPGNVSGLALTRQCRVLVPNVGGKVQVFELRACAR